MKIEDTPCYAASVDDVADSSACHYGSRLRSKLHSRSIYPSPLSAFRGFFGSKPFSKINIDLVEHEMDPIDWIEVKKEEVKKEVKKEKEVKKDTKPRWK